MTNILLAKADNFFGLPPLHGIVHGRQLTIYHDTGLQQIIL